MGNNLTARRLRARSAIASCALLGVAVAGSLVAAPPASAALVPVNVIVDDAVAGESAGTIVFTVHVQQGGNDVPAPGAVNVTYSTTNGTALASGDYTASSGDATIPNGSSTTTITVPIAGDTIDEDDETFTLQIASTDVNVTVTDADGVGTITDDDAAPLVSIADANAVTEGDTGTVNASFPVTLSGPSARTLSVSYATSNGTAVAPGDYATTNSSVTFLPGETTAQAIVAVNGDTTDESNETFTATLSSPVNTTIGTASALGTINDDDLEPSVSVGNVTVTEGASGTVTASFPVTLSPASGRSVSVNLATSDGTASAPADYTSVASAAVSFAVGETSTFAHVTVNGDALDEDDETFTVTLSSPSNATLGTGTATATITDSDAAPSVAVGNAVAVTEGNSGTVVASFPVSLSTASGRTVSVNFSTSNATAVAPGDYLATSGTVTFAPGETSKTALVNIAGDTVDENDETFNLVLSSPTNAALGSATASVTITDDDALPQLSIDNDDAAAVEGPGEVIEYRVRLSSASGRVVTVNALTSSGSGSSWDYAGATSGTDFVAVNTTLIFNPGETQKTLFVTVLNDGAEEPLENMSLSLSSPSNASTGSPPIDAGTGYIFDDDVPDIVVDATDAYEGDDILFTIRLTHASTLTVRVRWIVGGYTATPSTDFASPFSSTEVTFDPGETAHQVAIYAYEDDLNEGDETLALTLYDSVNAYVDYSELGTIHNTPVPEPPPTFTPTPCCPTPGATPNPPIVGPMPPPLPLQRPPFQATPLPIGSALVMDAVGGVHAFGSAEYRGSLPERGVPSDVIDIARGPDGTYYVLDAAGGVHVFGPGAFHGSLPGRGIPTRVVAIDVAPDGTYYVLDAVGGVHVFGPGAFHGSLPGRGIPTRVVDLTVGDDGTYYVLDAVGGVHVFGPGAFHGSLPGRNIPSDVIAMDAGPGGSYYVLDAAGGVHVFGPGRFLGSLPGRRVLTKGVDLSVGPSGTYSVLDASGKVHEFGTAGTSGALSDRGVNSRPIALAG